MGLVGLSEISRDRIFRDNQGGRSTGKKQNGGI